MSDPDTDDSADMAFSPFTLKEFMAVCRRCDAEAAKVPLSTFYGWKKEQNDISLSQFHALVRAKRCYLRVVHGPDKEKLSVIKQQRTGTHHRRE